jgi:hypothetical protein
LTKIPVEYSMVTQTSEVGPDLRQGGRFSPNPARFEYGRDGDSSRYEGSMEKDLADVGPENYYPKLQPKSYS